ncbi:MAG TPA: DUF3102 domain-containing protein [Stenomitos sp.]
MSSTPQNHYFDYAALDEETRTAVKGHAQVIQTRLVKTVQEIIVIGQELQAVKQKLKYGLFHDWLRTELGMHPRQANRFIQVAQQFSCDKLSQLEIAPSALYLLSEIQTPDSARQEAVNRAKQGEKVSLQLAKEIISRHKKEKSFSSNQKISAPSNEGSMDEANLINVTSISYVNESNLRPEHAIIEVMVEIMPDDSLPDSAIPEQIQAQSTYTMGDRVRILRRQMGQDEWCGEIAKVWNISDDGWLRVDVEGHPGVRFTLHPNWVELVDEISREVNMSESTANKASNDPIRVVLPVEIEGQQVNVEGIVTAVDVAYTLNGESHQINLPADKIVFPR